MAKLIKQEKEILDQIVAELRAPGTSFRKKGIILENINSRLLPGSEIKQFFQKAREQLYIVEGLAGQVKDEENLSIVLKKTKQMIKILEKTSNKFEKGNHPKEVPWQIINNYYLYLDSMLLGVEKSLRFFKTMKVIQDKRTH